MAKKKVALCTCPAKEIPADLLLLPSSNGFPALQEQILELPFALASTVTDSDVRIWKDVADLVSYLVHFDIIATFNGNQFDFPLIAGEIARLVRQTKEGGSVLVKTTEFQKVYQELFSRSYDLAEITRVHTGARTNLANLAATTLKVIRKHSVKTGVACWLNKDIAGAANFTLEGAILASDLHYVAQELRKLAMTGVDDAVIQFEV